jgi:hypothetical protein
LCLGSLFRAETGLIARAGPFSEDIYNFKVSYFASRFVAQGQNIMKVKKQ